MITRIWHGKTKQAHATTYLDFLLGKGTREYRETPGNLSVRVWKKQSGTQCHFYTVTEWENLESIKRFEGPEFETAVYYPEDKGMLLEFEKKVQHFESYDVSTSRIKDYVTRLNLLMDGEAWVGENFLNRLNGLEESLAFKVPFPGLNSIAAIIWHCSYWETVGLQRILGNYGYLDQTVGELNFPPLETLQAKGWDAIENGFLSTHRELVETLGRQTDGFLCREYNPGLTYAHLIDGIIQHNAYHLGQVVLILKMIGHSK